MSVRRVLTSLALGLFAVGCGETEPREVAADSTADSTNDAPARGAGSVVPLVTYRLELVNRTASTLRVAASAGAGQVALDTLASGDSVRVNLLVGAETVRLEATDTEGDPVSEIEVTLHPDSLNRWVIREGS